MKTIFLFFAMLSAPSVFANSHIDLSPGSSVTVRAGETTVVTCNGNGGSSNRNSHFCRCKSSGTLIRVDIVDGNSIETIVHEYSNGIDCGQNLPRHPSCN